MGIQVPRPESRGRLSAVRIGALAIGLMILAGGFIFIQRERYLIVAIDAPMVDLPHGDWYLEERTVRTWTDSGARYFIWRRRALADGDRFQSWGELVGDIEGQLADLGWERHPSPQGVCSNHFIEAQFLPEGENGYLAFIRSGSDPDQRIPFVCVAAWPYGGKVDLYEVTIMTINPSLFVVVDGWFR